MELNKEDGPRNARTVRGGVIMVSLYSWTCITMGVALARVIIALQNKLQFGRDDATALTGSLIYLGATVSWQYAVNAGLGKPLGDLHPGDSERYFKAAYAAQLLQMTAIALAKLSTVFLIDRVAVETRSRKIFLLSMVGLWFVYSIFTLAFQCGIPKPWEVGPHKCAYGGPLISAVVLGMMVDFVLAWWIFPVLLPLRMAKAKVATVAMLFAARFIVPVVAGGQVWAIAKAMRSDDPTRDGFEMALFFQAVASLSLIITNLPRIKRFLDVSGSSVLINPRITENEIALSNHVGTGASSSRDQTLRLVPTNSTKFTTTVVSENAQRQKDKATSQQEWQKFMSMGGTQDEHTSTSSLCEHEGVMLYKEVTVRVEDR
ncbi:hypothetical protein CC80DRAFT_567572 [Byssothecium circinans]|uniref:Rhodopsin domain-containing protein n=1 Tax=Byssothecium circinans TaxID=147558 RepID=A0A6A5TRS3_9PLEO|nr:hypothetical protein CC80DRAFT_567572 [Byssothecium circinans]